MTEHPRTEKLIVLSATIAWQVWLILTAWRDAPILGTLLSGLGAEPAPITAAYLASYRFWPLLPVVSAVLSFLVLRRDPPAPRRAALVLAYSLTSTLLLQAWMMEASIRPLFLLIKRLG